MALYLLISEAEDARAPVFATRDPTIIAAVGREIARRLGAKAPTVRKLRTATALEPRSEVKEPA